MIMYMVNLEKIFKNNYLIISKPLLKELGINACLMLSELYSEYKYYNEKKLVNDFGYFYSTSENVKNNIGLSNHKQSEAIKILVEYKIIKEHVYGMPAKRYFAFEPNALKRLEEIIKNQTMYDNKNIINDKLLYPDTF